MKTTTTFGEKKNANVPSNTVLKANYSFLAS